MLHRRRFQRQRRIQQGTAQRCQVIPAAADLGESRPCRLVFQVALAEKQLHAALANGGFIRRFLTGHHQRSQQRIGYLRLIGTPAHALVPVIAVAKMVVQSGEPGLVNLRGLEFVQRLRKQVAGGRVLHERKASDLGCGHDLAPAKQGQDHPLQRGGLAAARLANQKQMRVLDAHRVQHFLDETPRAPCQHRHRFRRLVVAKQQWAKLGQLFRRNGFVPRQLRFNGRIFLQLHHVRHVLAARGKGALLVHIRPTAFVLIQPQRLHAVLHLPRQSGQIGFQHLQIAVAAHVAKGDRALVQHRLEFLRRREIRGHEGKPEGFAVHGHEVAGHLRFVLGHQHFQRAHHEIGQRVDVLAALPHITPIGLENAQIAARRIDIFGASNGLRQRFFAVGRAVRMVNIVPFLPEQLRLAEQPVHLLPVSARPEGQRAA